MLNNYALIVGVEDYRAFDPSGKSNVPGALNDARSLIRECLAMGFAPERIRVLTSPALAEGTGSPEAAGILFGEATRDGIEAGLQWLYTELSRPEPASGLATFSGHGLLVEALGLCPGDFDGSEASILYVSDVRAAFGTDKATDSLTVLLDCCNAQGNARTQEGVAARLSAFGEGKGLGAIPERLLAGSQADQSSVASRFSGVMQGAFTWAATAAMGQWKTTVERNVARLDVSYGELLQRVRGLLGALSFEQTPVLAGPLGVAAMPVLGCRMEAGETAEDPNAERPPRQLTPDDYWIESIFADGSTSEWGWALCTDNRSFSIDGVATDPATEYWYIDSIQVAGLDSITRLKFSPRGLQPNKNYSSPDFLATTYTVYDQNAEWRSTTELVQAASGGTSHMFSGTSSLGTVYLQFLLDSEKRLTNIYWYARVNPEAEPDALLTPDDFEKINTPPPELLEGGNWVYSSIQPEETTRSRIIAGYIGSAGNIVSASPPDSFTVEKVGPGDGLYEVRFKDSFSSEPGVAAKQIYDEGDGEGADTKANVNIPILQRSKVRFKTGNYGGAAVDRNFSFIAVGG
ncbi:MAG: caspase family protein [Polyangiaceae bacterium]